MTICLVGKNNENVSQLIIPIEFKWCFSNCVVIQNQIFFYFFYKDAECLKGKVSVLPQKILCQSNKKMCLCSKSFLNNDWSHSHNKSLKTLLLILIMLSMIKRTRINLFLWSDFTTYLLNKMATVQHLKTVFEELDYLDDGYQVWFGLKNFDVSCS